MVACAVPVTTSRRCAVCGAHIITLEVAQSAVSVVEGCYARLHSLLLQRIISGITKRIPF